MDNPLPISSKLMRAMAGMLLECGYLVTPSSHSIVICPACHPAYPRAELPRWYAQVWIEGTRLSLAWTMPSERSRQRLCADQAIKRDAICYDIREPDSIESLCTAMDDVNERFRMMLATVDRR